MKVSSRENLSAYSRHSNFSKTNAELHIKFTHTHIHNHDTNTNTRQVLSRMECFGGSFSFVVHTYLPYETYQ